MSRCQLSVARARFSAAALPGYRFEHDADRNVEKTSGVLAADGETIQFWRSQAGSSGDASQATSGLRPVLRSTGGPNSHRAIEFAAAAAPSLATGAITLAQIATVAIVVLVPALPSQGYIYDAIEINRRTLEMIAGPTLITRTNGGGGTPNLVEVTTAGWHVITVVWNGASSEMYVDGVLAASGDAGTADAVGTMGGITYGQPAGFSNPTYSADTKIARCVGYDGILSAGNLAILHAGLMAWAGL